MSLAFGHKLVFGFGEEVTYNSAVAPSKFLEVTEESIQGKQTWLNKPALRELSMRRKVFGKKSVEGSFAFQFPLTGAERILRHALGALQTTNAGGGNYTHVFTPYDDLPTGLSLHCERDKDNGIIYVYTGCQIQKLTLTQKHEDFLMAQAEVIGADWAEVADAVPTYPPLDAFDFGHVVTAQIGGIEVSPEEIELTIENVLQSDRYKLGSRSRRGLGRNAPRKISLKITAELDSVLVAEMYDNGDTTPVTLKWEITNTPPMSLQIDLANAVFSGEHPTTKDAGIYKQTLNLEAYVLNNLNDELTVTLKNQTSTP